jgi:hypothetical protein
MPTTTREIGYFYYVSRNKIKMYGSGDFINAEDTGYIYGWTETLSEFRLVAYLKTFTFDTIKAKAGLQFRQEAKNNVPFIGMFLDGSGKLKIHRRTKIDGSITFGKSATLGVTQGVWLEMKRTNGEIEFNYSLNPENTLLASIAWTNLDTIYDESESYPTLEKHLSCSSGSDNVNLAYYTKVYTEGCWISPIGQKED